MAGLPGNIAPPTGAWKNIQEIVKDTVGPMAVLGVAANAFLKATAGAAFNAEKLRRALAASSGAEQLRGQFQAMGLSAEQATAKVNGLAAAASKSAFSFEALGAAAKNLMAVGGAAADSAAMLKRVQDVAAAAGAPVDAVATAMGELYAQAGKGGNLSGAASGLASLGAISQETAAKVQGLAAAGAPAADGLRLIEGELAKSKGAGAALAGTLTGLSAQLENLQKANDTKIGDLFLEGEKAGLRAAIAFEKVRGEVDAVATAPFAAVSNGVNSIKEAIANLVASEGGIATIKGLFVFLATAAVATVGVLIAQLAMFAATLLKTAAAAIKATGALTAAGGAFGKWLTFFNTATGRANLYAAALALVAVKAYETVDAIKASTKAVEDLSKANQTQAGKNNAMIMKAATPEEKAAAMDSLDAQIRENDESLNKAREDRDKAAEKATDAQSWGNWKNWVGIGGFDQASTYADYTSKDNIVTQTSAQGSLLRKQRDTLVKRSVTGLSAQELEQKQERTSLEEDIRKQARQRLQGLASPQGAKEAADVEVKRAGEKLAKAEADSKASFDERRALGQAQVGMIASREDPKKFGEALDAMQNLQPTSEVGKLSKDLAMRETLSAELSQATADSQNQGLTTEARNAAGERAQMLKQRIADQYGGGNFAVGLDQIQGAATQDLKARRDKAIQDGDPNQARLEQAQALAVQQQANEAVAADKASVEAGRRKLALDKEVSGLRGREGGEAAAAKLEGESRTNELNDQLAAANKVEAAQAALKKVREGKGSEEEEAAAVARLNAARTAAAATGLDLSTQTVASVENELAAVEQITQARLQQAAIDEAAAKSRRDAAMQELKLRQQMAQLRFGVETGAGGGGPSEAALKIADEQKTRARAEDAKGLVAERDKLTEKAASGVELSADETKRRDELDRKIAGLGFDKGTTAQDLDTEIGNSRAREAELRVDQIAGGKDIAAAVGAAALSVQERYARSPEERQKFKKQREEAEDEATVAAKTAEYSKVMDEEDARALATEETKLDRLNLQAQEAGTARVDSLTAVGGGATGFIGAAEDPQKKIAKQAEVVTKLVEDLKEAIKEQTQQAKDHFQELKNE